jgi:fumarate hydratase class I
MKNLQIPFSESEARQLQIGELVVLNGVICTGRDAVHRVLCEGQTASLPEELIGGVIFHCGPVMLKDEMGQWRCIAAGPTTSIRHELYQATVIERYRLRGVIGKGGMGNATREALRKFGCVYFHAIGGAAQVLAECVVRVKDVYFLEEFGSTEALWVIEVRNFPVVVTMDAHGGSLHDGVASLSQRRFKELLHRIT